MKSTYSEVVQQRAEQEYKHNLFQQGTRLKNKKKYCSDKAIAVTFFITKLMGKYMFWQQYTLEKGLKKFGNNRIKGTEKEMG